MPDSPPLADPPPDRAAAHGRADASVNTVLWHPEDGHFDPALLRRAIVSRGWTVSEFAQTSRIHPGTLYRALTGKPTSDGTAIRIFQTLEKRRPMDTAI